jgi:hypothetical protein
MARKVTKVKDIRLHEVSLVGEGANQHARVGIWKAKDGEGGKTCAECDHEADCMAEGKCLMSGQEIAKDDEAKDFNEALDDQQVYRRMDDVYQMTSALTESIRSILQDDDVTDKAAKIAESLEQFASAAKAKLEGIAKGKDDAATGGNETGVSGQDDGQGGNDMTKENAKQSPENAGDDNVKKMIEEAVAKASASFKAVIDEKDAEIKKLNERVTKMTTDDLMKDSLAKAKEFSGLPGVKPEDLAKAILETPPEAFKVFEAIFKASNEAIKAGKTFAELGGQGSAPDVQNSGLVKAAQKRADEIAKAAKAA